MALHRVGHNIVTFRNASLEFLFKTFLLSALPLATEDCEKMTDDKFFSSLGLRESAFPITREAKDHRWSLQTRPQTQPNTPAAKRPAVEGRMKTELCKHVVAGSNLCPYKERCAFAHSISELKFCKFSDYVADLDEASFFRSRPCFDWVALGSW